MSLTIDLVDAPLGHAIRGVDLGHLDDASFGEIEAAFDSHGVIVIRDQTLSPEQQLAFSERFGPLERYMLERFNLPEQPMIFVVSNIIEDGRAVGMADAGQYWHSDMWLRESPPRGSVMYALEVPHDESGEALGDTLFASMQAAYDALPEPTRARIDGLRCVYSGAHYVAHRRRTTPAVAAGTREAADARDALESVLITHPLVRRHPRTGRHCLYLSEGAISHIEGLDRAESDDLLAELYEHVIQPRFVYRHKWRVGDVVMWDNCSAIHRATSDYQLPQRRRMYRTTIAGTPTS